VEASVTVGPETVGAIGCGLLVLLGIERGDDLETAAVMAKKLSEVRCFNDDYGKINCNARAVGGAFLIVSQFTLAGSLARGRRPSFERAAPPEVARPLVAAVGRALRTRGFETASGRFGADMRVRMVGDGPVTLVLDVKPPAEPAGAHIA